MPEIELRPKNCPRCGREAWFVYANGSEALRRSPLCWGEREQECPGYPVYLAEIGAIQ